MAFNFDAALAEVRSNPRSSGGGTTASRAVQAALKYQQTNKPKQLLPTPKPAQVKTSLLGHIENATKDVEHVGSSVVKNVAAPVVGLVKDLNKEEIQPAISQAKQVIQHPSILIHGTAASRAASQQHQQFNNNVKAGKISPTVVKTVNNPVGIDNNLRSTLESHVNQLVANKVPDQAIQQHVNNVINNHTASQNAALQRISAEVVGTGSLFVGGGEVGELAKAGASAVKDAAESEAPSIVTKAANFAKGNGKLAAAGATGNVASTVQSNPKASTKQLVESGLEGFGGALVAGAAGKIGGKAVRTVIGKITNSDGKVIPTPKPVKIAVTSTSKSMNKGTGGETVGYHGSTNPNLTKLDTGAKLGLNEKRNLIYLSDTKKGATPYTKVRAPDGTLSDSATGKVYGVSVKGKIIDGINPTDIKSLKTLNGYDNLSPLTKRHIDNAISLNNIHPDILEANPELVKYLSDNGISGVKTHFPNSPGDKQIIVTNPSAAKIQNPLTQSVSVGKSKDSLSKGLSTGRVPTPKTGNVVDDLPIVPKNDTSRQAVVNRSAAISNTLDTFHVKEANAAAKQLDAHDMKLVERVESNKPMSDEAADARMVRIAKDPEQGAHNPEAFIKYNRIIRGDLNTVLAHRQALHPETGKIPNYFPHIFDKSDQKTQDLLNSTQYARIGKGEHPSYTQHRLIPTYQKAEQLGLKRANSTVHQDYLQTIRQTAQENGKAALIKGLREAHGVGAVSNKVGYDAASGQNFDALHIPGGKGITLPQKLADFYNSREPTKLSTTPNADRTATQKGRAGYKVVNKAGKNVVLAGGLFHGLRTAVTTAGQQLFSFKRNLTHPLSQLADNLRLIGETVSPKIHAARIKQLSEDSASNIDKRSTIQRARLFGLTYTSKDIQADLAERSSESGINRVPGLKQAHEAVFSRQIPAAKLMLLHQLTSKLNSDVPADLAKGRAIAAGINKGLGGINNAVDGLTPKVASAVDNVILGRDINEGIVETVGHAFKPNSTDGRLARQFVVGSAVVAALPGLVTLAATGKLNVKDPKAVAQAFVAQLENPQIPTPWRNAPTKTNPKGTPISLKMPTTFVSFISKILHPVLDPNSTYSGSRTSGLQDTATGRLAFLPAAAEKLVTNKDFYGQPIRVGNAKQTATNVAEQFSPIPFGQVTRGIQGKENAGSKAQNVVEASLNELGLRGSTSTLPSAQLTHTQRLNDFYNTTKALVKSRAPVLAQMKTLRDKGQYQQALRIAQEWNQTQLPKVVQAFRSKYANNYNPAFDDNRSGFMSYLIPTSGSSAVTSLKDQRENARIDQ